MQRFWVAHASRVLVSASRRNNLLEVRNGEDAIASTRDACATRISRCSVTDDTMNLPKRIAVLMGGPGSERDVSLATARGVAKALRWRGAEVFEVDVRDENFELPKDIDLAFIAIHGTFGEDGQLQQILEDRGVPYTGDGVKENGR